MRALPPRAPGAAQPPLRGVRGLAGAGGVGGEAVCVGVGGGRGFLLVAGEGREAWGKAVTAASKWWLPGGAGEGASAGVLVNGGCRLPAPAPSAGLLRGKVLRGWVPWWWPNNWGWC